MKTIQLDDKTYGKLRKFCKERGLIIRRVVQMWIEEKLKEVG